MRFLEHYENIPTLILPIGISSSGKSTWIKEFNNNDEYTVVSPDEVRRELTGDISDHSHERQVWWLVEETVKKLLDNGESVILDATNVDKELRDRFISEMPKCKLKAKVFDVDPETAKSRIKGDIEGGIDRSRTPDEVVDKQYDKFKSTVASLEADGFEIIE